MKILITSNSYLPRLGGAEIHAFKLGLFFQKRGHQVRLFTPEPSNESDEKSPFKIVRLKYSRKLRPLIKFYKTLNAEIKNADAISCIYSHKLAAAVGVINLFYKKPMVVTLEGRGILDLPGNNWFYGSLHTLYRVVSLKLADKIIASCTEFVTIASKYTRLDKIIYIPNSLDVEEFKIRPKNVKLLPFPLGSKKIVATIRRLVPKNGIQFIVEAIPYVVEKYSNVLFYLIGWGRMEDYLKNRVKELGIEKYVYFAGRIENDKLPDYLNLADLVVFPSTAESTSIACLESMALAKPILASKVGGYLDMIEDGYNGFLVNLTDDIKSDYDAPQTLPEAKLKNLAEKIVTLISDGEKMAEFGRNSRIRAEKEFNWYINIDKILNIFENLLESNKTKLKISQPVEIKDFYSNYHDQISAKRYNSKYPLRNWVHGSRVSCFLGHLKNGEEILEIGCGDGYFTVAAARLGYKITATDISMPNIENAKKIANENGVTDLVTFIQADAENLPFSDNEFDLVIASHVLEHLPNFKKGLEEVYRVTKSRAIIALPTILNPCSMIIVGSKNWWYFSKGGLWALLFGFIKSVVGIIKSANGIEEGSYGNESVPHLWRYPWVMKKELKKQGFNIRNFEPDSLPLPYFNSFLTLIKFLDRHRAFPVLRNFGYGSHAVVEKSSQTNIER